jgi:glyoxalase/bleomycin resistance protein/dioxygenase superfamily protein
VRIAKGVMCVAVRPLLLKLDAVSVRVPDLDSGLRYYCDALGHELRWRNDSIGVAG